MRRAEIVPSATFDCGTILSSAGFDRNHKQLCKFSCFRCPLTKVAIYAEVVSGRVRSCGCLKGELVRAHYLSLLAKIPIETRKLVFTSARYQGAKAAGKARGLDKVLANYIIRAEWHRLSGFDFEAGVAVFRASQRSMQEAMAVFGMTAVEVEAVCFIFQRSKLEAEDLKREAWLAMAPDERLEATQFVQRVRDDIEDAIETAGDENTNMVATDPLTGELYSHLKGRYRGEFTPHEFATNPRTRSIYGKVYGTLMLVPAQVRESCFGAAAERFIEICEYSISSRRSRKASKLMKDPVKSTSLSPKPATARSDSEPAFTYSIARAGELVAIYALAMS